MRGVGLKNKGGVIIMKASGSVRSPAGATFVIALLLCAGGATADVIHKWVDENGRVHFGDRPPVAVETEIQYLEGGATVGTADEAAQQEMQQIADELEESRREKQNIRQEERRRQEAEAELQRQAAEREREREREQREAARQEQLREQTGTYGAGTLPRPGTSSVAAQP